jgi:dienelactone hydrolase
MTGPSFGLRGHLDFVYEDYLRNRIPGTPETLREAFRARLGLAGRMPPPVAAEREYSIDRTAFTEEKIRLASGEDVSIPVYVLVPKGKPPFKPVLVFPGHDPSVHYCIGDYPDPNTARIQRSSNNNYAEYLAEHGFLVAAVEQRGLGERRLGPARDGEVQRSCRELSFAYLLAGRTLMGERCWDGMCAATYLASRPEAAAGGLGCTGHSGGGATALWLAVLDDRIQATVVSGYFCSFRDSILAMDHCECNYIPGILTMGEMGDLAALLAPRPFCAVNGEADPLFPAAAAKREFETVRRAYAAQNAEAACRLALHPGGHVYHCELGRSWLDRWL